jgi:hypothetical protein
VLLLQPIGMAVDEPLAVRETKDVGHPTRATGRPFTWTSKVSISVV